MPLPPYITASLDDPELYQTVFAADERSAAAPTAGLHFTDASCSASCEAAGVRLAKVELDIGLDTFRPIAEDDPREHRIHTEHYRVPPWAAEAVNAARERGGRVVAVGTTAVRALESAWDEDAGRVGAAGGARRTSTSCPATGSTPSTPCSRTSTSRVRRCCCSSGVRRSRARHARVPTRRSEQRYRFLSFGDAMLII